MLMLTNDKPVQVHYWLDGWSQRERFLTSASRIALPAVLASGPAHPEQSLSECSPHPWTRSVRENHHCGCYWSQTFGSVSSTIIKNPLSSKLSRSMWRALQLPWFGLAQGRPLQAGLLVVAGNNVGLCEGDTQHSHEPARQPGPSIPVVYSLTLFVCLSAQKEHFSQCGCKQGTADGVSQSQWWRFNTPAVEKNKKINKTWQWHRSYPLHWWNVSGTFLSAFSFLRVIIQF